MTIARTLGEGKGSAFLLLDMTNNIFKMKDFSLWSPRYSIYLDFWRERATPKAGEGKLLCNQAIPLQVTTLLQRQEILSFQDWLTS